MTSPILLFSLVLISLACSAFFSGMEIAYISASKLKIEIDNKKGGVGAKILAFLSRKPAWFIAAMLTGNNIALVVYTLYMAKLLIDPLSYLGLENEMLILLVQTLFSTFFILLFAEFLPKAIFRLNSNTVLKVFSGVLLLFYFMLWPVTAIVVYLTKLILKCFGKEDGESDKISFKKTDLDHYLEDLKKDLDADEDMEHDVKIFHNALGFSEVIARDCMVPRNEILALEINDEVAELKKLFIETGFSRILIYKENIDNIIGYVHSVALFKLPENIKSILLPVGIIPESMSANKILEDFIEKKRNVFVVVDEYGGTAGILTMEDIIEEIFGEIDDEHDQEAFIHEQISDDKYVFSSRLEIDFINEKYRLNLPVKEDYETLGGMIIHYAETIPEKGASFLIDNYEVVVLEVEENKIVKVGLKISVKT